MRHTSFREMHCSLARSLEVMGDWWSPLILRDLSLGLQRFDELVADLGISRNLLTDRLATLVAAGVVEKRPYQERPVRYRYRLTEAGRELVPVLLALTAWGDRWATPEGGPPLRFTHSCGATTTPRVCCDACGEPLEARDVKAHAGPGGRSAPGTALFDQVVPGEPAS